MPRDGWTMAALLTIMVAACALVAWPCHAADVVRRSTGEIVSVRPSEGERAAVVDERGGDVDLGIRDDIASFRLVDPAVWRAFTAEASRAEALQRALHEAETAALQARAQQERAEAERDAAERDARRAKADRVWLGLGIGAGALTVGTVAGFILGALATD